MAVGATVTRPSPIPDRVDPVRREVEVRRLSPPPFVCATRVDIDGATGTAMDGTSPLYPPARVVDSEPLDPVCEAATAAAAPELDAARPHESQ